MTKRNIVALCGLLAASGLQASETSQSTQQTASDQGNMSWSWRKRLGLGTLGTAGLGGAAYAGSRMSPGWGSYLWNKGGDALSTGWSGLKATPGAIGSGIYSGWEGAKAIPGATWSALKATPSTVASYATHPYISEQYPIAGNVAAGLAAAATTGALYKGVQYAAQKYYGNLDDQIASLIVEDRDKTLSEDTRANIRSKLTALLAQKAEQLVNQFPNEGIYQTIERLNTLLSEQTYASQFAHNTLRWYINTLIINLLQNHQAALATQAGSLTQRAFSAETKAEREDILIAVEAIKEEIDKILDTINERLNVLKGLQSPVIAQPQGWFRRSK